jgi:rhodanese-related sulfurtransferase
MAKHHSPRFLKIAAAARQRVRELTVAQVQAKLGGGAPPKAFVLIDVREDHEWTAGHLPGAEHLGKGILERDIEVRHPDPATEIVLYCGGGFRSALAAESLQRMGYTNVWSMQGGFSGWRDAGHAIVGEENE